MLMKKAQFTQLILFVFDIEYSELFSLFVGCKTKKIFNVPKKLLYTCAVQVHSWYSGGEDKYTATRRHVMPRDELRTSRRLRHTATDEQRVRSL